MELATSMAPRPGPLQSSLEKAISHGQDVQMARTLSRPAIPTTYMYFMMIQERPTSLPAPRGVISTAWLESEGSGSDAALRLDMVAA